MTIRDRLHGEIERIPEESLEQAFRMLESLVINGKHEQSSGKSFYETSTPEEFKKALDLIAAGNEGLPILPPEAFERETLYQERF